MSQNHDGVSDKDNYEKRNEESRSRPRTRNESNSSRSSGSSGRSSSSNSQSSSGSSSSGSSSRSNSQSSRSSSSSSNVAPDLSTSQTKPKIRPRSSSRSPRRFESPRKSRSLEKRSASYDKRSLSRSPDRKQRKDDVKRAKPLRNEMELDHRRSPSPKRRRKRSPSPKLPRIYISKLTRNVHKEHIHEIFSNYGRIKFVDMPTVKQYQSVVCNRGYAYVEFEMLESAEKALRMDGGQIDGQEVLVEMADFSHTPSDLRRIRSPPPRNDFFPRGGRGWRRGPPPRYFRGRMRSPPRRWSPVRQPRRRSRSPVRHRRYSRSSSSDSR